MSLAIGGDCLADVAQMRAAHPQVFGPVASDPTVSRLIDTSGRSPLTMAPAPGIGTRSRRYGEGNHVYRASTGRRTSWCAHRRRGRTLASPDLSERHHIGRSPAAPEPMELQRRAPEPVCGSERGRDPVDRSRRTVGGHVGFTPRPGVVERLREPQGETHTPEANANPDAPGPRRPARLSRGHPGPGLCLDSRRPGLP